MQRREFVRAGVGSVLLGTAATPTVSAQQITDRAGADPGDVIFQFTAGDRNVAGFIKHKAHIICVYEGGAIVRVHARTRRVQWSVELDDRLGVPLCVGDIAFVPSDTGVLYAVDMNRGRVAWRFDAEAQITTQPVLHRKSGTDEETLYFPTAGEVLIGIDPATGEVRQLIECEDVVRHPPLIIKSQDPVVGDRMYTSNGDDRLVCRELPSGDVSWQTRFRTSDLSSPSISEKKVAVTTPDTLHLFRSQTGEKIDTRAFESEIISPPTLYKNKAYLATIGEENSDGEIRDNTIHRMSTLDGLGSDYWTLKTDITPTIRPVIDDNRMLYTAGANGVVAIDDQSGSERWTQQIEAVTNPVLEADRLHIGSGSGVTTLRRLRGTAETIRSKNAIGSHSDDQGYADSPVTANADIEDKSISDEVAAEKRGTVEGNQRERTEDSDTASAENDIQSTESDGSARSGPDLTKQVEENKEALDAPESDMEDGSSVLKLAGVMTGSAAVGTGSVAVLYKKFF